MVNITRKFRYPTVGVRWLNPSAVRGAMAGFSIAAVLGLVVISTTNTQFTDTELVVTKTPKQLPTLTQQLAMNVIPAEAKNDASAQIAALNSEPVAVDLSHQDTSRDSGATAQVSREPAITEVRPMNFASANDDSNEQQKLDVHGLQTANWVLEQSPDRYVIQILAAKEVDVVDRFLRTAVIDRKIALYQHQRNQEQWYVLVKGKTYHSYDDAKQASKKLPKLVLNAKPWIRPVTDVQADIRKATEFGTLQSMM